MSQPQGASLFPAWPSGSGAGGLGSPTSPASSAAGSALGGLSGLSGTAADLFPNWQAALSSSIGSTGSTGFSGAGPGPGAGQAVSASPTAVPAGALPQGTVQGTTGSDWQAQVAEAAQANGVPPAVLSALVQQESGGNPDARSPVGAMGLTQLMPSTAASLGVDRPYDPVQNLWGGAEYLGEMLHRFGSLPLALAAYNAGPGAVSQWGGIPPYPQTEAYVKHILQMSGMGTAVAEPSGSPGNGASLVANSPVPSGLTVTAGRSAPAPGAQMAEGP